ncbi:MAG: 50S ribosomal protein L17 [Verrucomicrobiota bacterium]|jgi:large subunit ribosomal protein L17|nr:50S ribosomal protein L17 [Verrucomicrobiota bacterium]MDD8044826.1 50S ribosomal protein L17 [Verrucomicrobiota bacterium]MDD8049706.1 50S ribosomal protein L17 [Verrucomicrobiota bacterium]MDI9385762.1 50S ribosomal protein L17 [Verrucomicrobiota bacterium]HCF95347.1 50S ribosomal protein L17 [Verrucomicrobiota bacterium]
MRHRKRTLKLGRPSAHRRLMLANLTCSLIQHGRVTTTRAKAKAVRQLADKMMTLAKDGSLHARRRAISILHDPLAVRRLFGELVEDHRERPGGYTRIMHLAKARVGDGSEMSVLEWSGPYAGPKAKKAAAVEAEA